MTKLFSLLALVLLGACAPQQEINSSKVPDKRTVVVETEDFKLHEIVRGNVKCYVTMATKSYQVPAISCVNWPVR